MPRGGKRGGARAPPRNALRLRSSHGVDRPGHSPGPGYSSTGGLTGFTLQDEARSTAHRSSPWSSDSRLRHRPVAFVSTGSTEPLKQLEDILQNEPADQPADGTPQCNLKLPEIQAHSALLDEPASTSDNTQLQNTVLEDKSGDFTASPTDMNATDATNFEGPDNPTSAETQPPEEAPVPLPFFLDVIGDRYAHRNNPPIRILSRSTSPAASDSSEEVILFKGRNKAARDSEKPFNLGRIRTEIGAVEETVKSSKDDHVALSASGSFNFRAQSWRDVRDQRRQEEVELIADYIANMREHGDDEGLLPAQAYSHRDLGGSLSESESIEESFQTVTDVCEPKPTSRGETELDSVTAATEGLTKGSDVEHLDSKKTPKKKNVPRVDDALLAVPETDGSYLGSIEQSHAEDASPQSETSDQEDDEDDIFTAAADRFANEVDDFDYMDWDRPALKRKKGKGARGKVPIFDISDSELEGKMQAAWKNDRLKKAERKRDRQALRAQGLLGKHANQEDLRVKYPDGMGLEHIAEELRAFLLGSQATLTFPPMDNHGRKIIHELASKFYIKSKSTGSGDQRRPMLHRTFRTAKFAEETFDMAIARVGRKYFPRNDTALRAVVQRQAVRRGGGGHAGVHYRDGEVVGGSAPELGQENRGRAMLEKMGWSSGTALGALNNKGILQPVAHVVKRSKAGLG